MNNRIFKKQEKLIEKEAGKYSKVISYGHPPLAKVMAAYGFEAGALFGIHLECERAKCLVEALEAYDLYSETNGQGRAAREALAKYRGEQ